MSRWLMADGWLKFAGIVGGSACLQAGGYWDARNVARLDQELRDLKPKIKVSLTFDLAQLQRLDTAGAWF